MINFKLLSACMTVPTTDGRLQPLPLQAAIMSHTYVFTIMYTRRDTIQGLARSRTQGVQANNGAGVWGLQRTKVLFSEILMYKRSISVWQCYAQI